jgi:uncharacterized protein YjbJ (UPF0337 family)
MHGGRELVRDGQDLVNSEKVKGTINDVAGRAKRQFGEWTGDADAQLEGFSQQLKGKSEKAWGAVKDAIQAGKDKIEAEKERDEAENR